jgi:signal transduction histidine kinase
MFNLDDGTLRMRVLYEMAMAIGSSLDLDVALRKALGVIARKLDCLLVSVFESDGSVLQVLPSRGLQDRHRAFVQQSLAMHHEADRPHRRGDLSDAQTGTSLYALALPGVGLLMLERRLPLDEITLASLEPVCSKLASSIQACRSNARLIEQERFLKSSLEALQQAQKAKDMFLANMSHELRTPLNGVLGFLDQLQATELSVEQQEYLNIVQESTRSLLAIINDILDFAKIESGPLAIETIPLDLAELLESLVRLYQAQGGPQGTEVSLQIDADVPAWIESDPLRLRQVLSNLLSNAVKFSPGGRVTLGVSRLAGISQGPVTLRFEVKDTGIGIAQDKLAHIFDPFTQADESTTRRFGGTGLGLAISRSLVELLGGRIEVSSALGQGSCFSVILPVTLAKSKTQAAPALATTLASPPRFSGKRVLVVEDNVINQRLMQAILARMDLAFDLASDGEQAVDLVARQRYDLILMDINMPRLDGEEACRRILEQHRARGEPAPPIVALTANVLPGDRERYARAGMGETLTKPLVMDELIAVLKRVLG